MCVTRAGEPLTMTKQERSGIEGLVSFICSERGGSDKALLGWNEMTYRLFPKSYSDLRERSL